MASTSLFDSLGRDWAGVPIAVWVLGGAAGLYWYAHRRSQSAAVTRQDQGTYIPTSPSVTSPVSVGYPQVGGGTVLSPPLIPTGASPYPIVVASQY